MVGVILARWQDWAGRGIEHLTLREDGDGVAVDSVVVGFDEETPFAARYRLGCDAAWRVRRLNLARGQAVDLKVAYVRVPALTIALDPQRYTCLEPMKLYRYDSLDSDFTRDIEVDDKGLVVTYPGLFRRAV
jgi:hypothetical protein